MTAGKYNTRITIQQLAAGQDSIGQPVQTWSDVCQVWSWPRTGSGISTIRSGADVSTVQTSFRIRWRTDITAGMRVVQGTAVHDIQAVLPDLEHRRHVDIVCKQVT